MLTVQENSLRQISDSNGQNISRANAAIARGAEAISNKSPGSMTSPRPQLALCRPVHIGTRLRQQCLIDAMPRYFFHVTNGDSLTDEEGEEFELFESAREQ